MDRDLLQLRNRQAYDLFSLPDEPAIMKFWERHQSDLKDVAFIRAVNEPTNLPLPQQTNLECGGFIRGLFAHDHLFFCNQHVLENTNLLGSSSVKIDASLAFDAMVPSYLAKAINGETNDDAKKGFALLDFLSATDLNFDVLPYLLENAPNMVPGQVAESQKFQRNLRAIEIVRDLDQDHYLRTKEIRPRCDETELLSRTKELREIGEGLNRDHATGLVQVHQMCYVMLLKASVIALRDVNKLSNAKLEALLEFCDSTLGAMLWREIIYITDLFDKTQTERQKEEKNFFSRIQRGNQKIFEALENMAWDMQIARRLEQFMTQLTTPKKFGLPYLVTFDVALVKIMDVYAIEQAAIFPDLPPITAPSNMEARIEARFQDIEGFQDRYLSHESRTRRVARTRDESFMPDLIRILEADLRTAAGIK
jgi:hypothetical protein